MTLLVDLDADGNEKTRKGVRRYRPKTLTFL